VLGLDEGAPKKMTFQLLPAVSNAAHKKQTQR
jgi:hypothetical protein